MWLLCMLRRVRVEVKISKIFLPQIVEVMNQDRGLEAVEHGMLQKREQIKLLQQKLLSSEEQVF